MRRRILLLVVILLTAACSQAAPGADRSARILLGAPSSLDPAAMGDAGSASIVAQLYETLTTFDSDRILRPALAESWAIDEGGRRVVFTLRPHLEFSDGTPLRPSDVVRSWLRIIDPGRPSPLAGLMADVRGAAARLGGAAADEVGLLADDDANELTVELERPSVDFVSIVASPTFAVVPADIDADPNGPAPGPDFVASGGYRLVAAEPDVLVLAGNPNYWAGAPPIDDIRIVTDLGGRSPVEAFEGDEVDYAPIDDVDATWIAYDPTLGPQLREVESLSTDYYGFDTSRPPFDDRRVRQAFATAVDWRRIAGLALHSDRDVATSMIPPGIPGRSDRDVLPAHDPEAARALLAAAGYEDGAGFPEVTLLTGGSPYDGAVIEELQRELGVTLRSEVMDFGDYFARLDDEPPQMWFLSWVADYPGRNDFLGVLLGTGASNNYGRWSSAEFDASIAEAVGATDADDAAAAYDRAEDLVRAEAPVVPVSYGSGWALSRTGLLGAGQNGMGSVRMAGLAWAP